MLKKIIFIFLFLFILVYLGLFVFIATAGKSMLAERLSQATGRAVKVNSVYLVPPYSVSIRDLEIKDLLAVRQLNIEPSVMGLLLRSFGLNKLLILEPEIYLVRGQDSEFNLKEVIDNLKSNRKNRENKQPKKRTNFFVKEARLRQGKILFSDKKQDFSLDIRHIDLSAITSLRDLRTRISLQAEGFSSTGKSLGDISGSGWLNFLKKDMQAEFKVANVDLAYFSPYFKKSFKSVQSGQLLLVAKMDSRDNDLVINCHIETSNLRFGEENLIMGSEGKKINLLENLSSLFLDTAVGAGSAGVFDFSIHTKFDRPRLEGLQFKGNIFKQPIKNIIKHAPKQSVETVKKVGKDFEALGRELKEQFEEIGDMFKEQRDSEKQKESKNTQTPVETSPGSEASQAEQ